MKKLILLMAAAAIAAMTLTSCEPDIENSSWLKGTTWKASLVGQKGMSPDEPLTKGWIKIHFTSNGYQLRIDSPFSKVILNTRLFPDYDYPTLYFPIEWEEVDKKPVNIVYNIGTFSEDLKTIHFDTFKDRGGYNEYYDIDFIRQ